MFLSEAIFKAQEEVSRALRGTEVGIPYQRASEPLFSHHHPWKKGTPSALSVQSLQV